MDRKSKRRVVVAMAVLAMLVGMILIAWLTIDRKGFRIGDESSDATVSYDGVDVPVVYLGVVEQPGGTSQKHSWSGSKKFQGGTRDGQTWSMSVGLEGQPGRWDVATVIGFPDTLVRVVKSPWVGPGDYPAVSENLKTGEKTPTTVRITIRGVP